MNSTFNKDQPYQSAVPIILPGYSADPVVLTKAAKRLLPNIQPGTRYARASIGVIDLRSVGA
jgi:DNA polymerase V